MKSEFSTSVKRILDNWAKIIEIALDPTQQSKLRMIVDGNFIFFFRIRNEIFGAPEQSRVVFAKMRDKNDEDGPEWQKHANFSAINLNRLGQGQQVQTIFGEKDLRSIEVLDKEEAYNALEEFFEKEKTAAKS